MLGRLADKQFLLDFRNSQVKKSYCKELLNTKVMQKTYEQILNGLQSWESNKKVIENSLDDKISILKTQKKRNANNDRRKENFKSKAFWNYC